RSAQTSALAVLRIAIGEHPTLRLAPNVTLPFSIPSIAIHILSHSFKMASIRANCRKVMCIGRNYADHITELNNTAPKQPFFFLKPPSSILTPGSGPVLRPKGVSLHYEVELGLVIGKTLRDLDPNDEKGALEAIQSYILAIDMTARNVQDEAKNKGLPWSIAKGFDTFLPISQEIAKSRIPNPHDAFLRLSVGQTERQADSTSLMLHRIPQQLAQISRVMTLEKGDLVLTGTPKGVGQVKAGDVLRASIEVDGKEIEEGRIEVEVQDREGRYEFKET
ncbi:hypothetical protein N7452_007624, partial [Penicillium brevicompactum]